MPNENPDVRTNLGPGQIKRQSEEDVEHYNSSSRDTAGGVEGQSRYGNASANDPGTSAPMDAPGVNQLDVDVNQQGSLGVNAPVGSNGRDSVNPLNQDQI